LNWYVDQPSISDMLFSQMNASVHAMLPAVAQAYLPAPVADVALKMSAQPDLFDNLNDPQNRYAMCLTCGEVK